MKPINTTFTIEITEEECRNIVEALNYFCDVLTDFDGTEDTDYMERRTNEAKTIRNNIKRIRNTFGSLVNTFFMGN